MCNLERSRCFLKAASISVTQCAEVTLGATCSLLPSVVTQSIHTAIHQHTPICQSHSLLLVSRVLHVWEFANSSAYANLLHECACVSKHVNVYMNSSRACHSVCFLFLCVYECVVVKRVRKKNTNLCDFTSAAQCFSLCPSVILSVRSGDFQQHKIYPQEIMCGHTWRLPNLLQQSYSRGGSRGYPLSEWLEWRRGAMDGKGGRQEGLDGEGSGGDTAFSGKHTPGAVRFQHLNTHMLKAAIQLFTTKSHFQQALTPFKRSTHPKDSF